MAFHAYSFPTVPHLIRGCVSSDNRRYYHVGENNVLALDRVEPGRHSNPIFEDYSGFRDQHLFDDFLAYNNFGVNGFACAEYYDRAWFMTYGGVVHMANTNTPTRAPSYLFSVVAPGTYQVSQSVGDLVYVPATNMLYGISGAQDVAFGMDGTSLKALFQSVSIGYNNESIAISKDLTKLYVSNSTTMVLRTIDSTAGTVSAVVSFGSGTGTVLNLPTCVRAHADGRVFVGYLDQNYHMHIASFTSAGAVITDWIVSDENGIPYGTAGSGDFDISHDGTQILCVNGVIIKTADGTVVERVFTNNYNASVRVAPNGERAYISGDTQHTAIQGFVPALSLTAGTFGSNTTLSVLSIPMGSTINFLLNYPFEAGNTYQLAASTGRDNPIHLPRGREVGINRDDTSAYTIRPNRPEFTLFHGQLNSSGAATMNLALDVAIPGVLPGARLYVTAVTFAGGLRRLSSIQSIANVCIIDIPT